MHDDGLNQLEPLPGTEGVVRHDPLDLRVPDDDPLQAIPDVDERIVLIRRTLAGEDQPVFHDDGVAPALEPNREHQEGADHQPADANGQVLHDSTTCRVPSCWCPCRSPRRPALWAHG